MKNKAFSLLELLIAIIIFTVGVVAVIGVFSTGLVGSRDTEYIAVAMNLCQKRVEEIRNLDFDDIDDEAKDDVEDFNGEFEDVFQREVDVSEPETDLKKVTVTTYWTQGTDETSVSLTTYISGN